MLGSRCEELYAGFDGEDFLFALEAPAVSGEAAIGTHGTVAGDGERALNETQKALTAIWKDVQLPIQEGL